MDKKKLYDDALEISIASNNYGENKMKQVSNRGRLIIGPHIKLTQTVYTEHTVEVSE